MPVRVTDAVSRPELVTYFRMAPGVPCKASVTVLPVQMVSLRLTILAESVEGRSNTTFPSEFLGGSKFPT